MPQQDPVIDAPCDDPESADGVAGGGTDHTGVGAAAETGPKPVSWREPLTSFVLATGVLLVLAIVAMGDAIRSCAAVVRGVPNDGTTGGVPLAWLWSRTGGGPFTTVQDLTGGGLGDLLWRPLFAVNTLGFVPMWAFTKIVSPVCAYNLTFVLGYVTSGWGMWFLVRRLVGGRAVPLGAAILFAFGAFPQMKAEWGHLSGVLLGLFPLLVLALLRLWEQRTVGRVLAAGACWGALPYVDGYHLAFSLLAVAGALAGVVVVTWRSRVPDRVHRIREQVLSTVLAGSVAVVVLVPLVATLLTDFGAVSDQTERSAADAARYGARVWEYLLPSPRHPLAPEAYSTWRYENMHRSNLAETAIGVGVVLLVLAVIGVRSVLRRTATGDPQRAAVSALVGVVVVGFACSLNPAIRVFGFDVPMPADLVHAVLPQVRVFSRLVILVSTGLVALAALGLREVASRVSVPSRRPLVVAGLVLASGFETLTFTPWSPPTWSYERTPAVFADVASDPTVDTVAMYPLVRGGEDGSTAFTYVPVMDKVVVNAFGDSGAVDDPVDVGRGIAALADPASIPVLRALGTDVVVVLDDLIGVDVDPPAGLELIRSYECDPPVAGVPPRDADGRDCEPARLFRVVDGEVARAAVALGAGWGSFEADGWGGQRSVSNGAQFELVPLGSAGGGDDAVAAADVTLTLTAPEATTVDVVEEGTGVIEQVEVGPGATDIAIVARAGLTNTLSLASGAAVSLVAIDVTPRPAG